MDTVQNNWVKTGTESETERLNIFADKLDSSNIHLWFVIEVIVWYQIWVR